MSNDFKYFTVRVDKDGIVTHEAHGFTGGDCVKSSFLSEALGKRTEQVKKESFFRKATTIVRNKLRA